MTGKTHKVANELNEPEVGEKNQTKCINRGGGLGGGLKATTPHERQLLKKRGRGEGGRAEHWRMRGKKRGG